MASSPDPTAPASSPAPTPTPKREAPTSPGPAPAPPPPPVRAAAGPLPPGVSAVNPNASATSGASALGAANPEKRESRGGPLLTEALVTQTLIARGFVTASEIQACLAQRQKLLQAANAANAADKDNVPVKAPVKAPNLMEILIQAKALTPSQSSRIIKELTLEQAEIAARKPLQGKDGTGEPGAGAANFPKITGYEILEFVGKGSMGMVYKARQTSVDRIVALKILLDTFASNAEYIERFKREAKIAARLSHTNIVNVYDAGTADKRQFFVMEFVEGETVQQFIDRTKMLEEAEAVRIMISVAEALKHAHSKGMIHRDIKPDNIILTTKGEVKLADLGLARPTDDHSWAGAEAGKAIGTPYYISPEQVRGQTDIDIRADIYSLGGTLYHMVTGRVPYEGSTPTEVMRKHINKSVEFTPPEHLNTKLSSGMGVVIETMLARDRERRYPSPDELLLDLRCLSRGENPVYAEQKLDSLASLAHGDALEMEESESRDDSPAAVFSRSDAAREYQAAIATRNMIIIIESVVLFLALLGLVILGMR